MRKPGRMLSSMLASPAAAGAIWRPAACSLYHASRLVGQYHTGRAAAEQAADSAPARMDAAAQTVCHVMHSGPSAPAAAPQAGSPYALRFDDPSEAFKAS